PRQAFSPAVAGRMRGHFRRLDQRLPAQHNRGLAVKVPGAAGRATITKSLATRPGWPGQIPARCA
ncbi:MAG TPA: hypothetical protein VMO17_00100, partial [Terriglobia bacterium]|nr:hypothetical protein [Terriglobia bacterium]